MKVKVSSCMICRGDISNEFVAMVEQAAAVPDQLITADAFKAWLKQTGLIDEARVDAEVAQAPSGAPRAYAREKGFDEVEATLRQFTAIIR